MIGILSGIGDVPTPTFWRWLCANSECALRCMGLCRILHDMHAPRLWAEDHFTFSPKLIIYILAQPQHLFLPSLIVTSSQVRVSMPFPLLSCCISGLGPEGLRQDLSFPHVLLVWDVNLASLLNKRRQSWTIHSKQTVDGIS